ncbi:MAG: transrane protein [Acidobacteria bacterium]|nr:transrane protein [Acidobacteriota bacterium]
MNDTQRRVDTDALFWGLILIGAGTLFLLDRLRIGDIHNGIHHYWPMFLVAMGASRIVNRRRFWSGVWLLIVGAWLQATVLHVNGLSWHSSWPLLLIGLGAMMVLRTLFEGARRNRNDGSAEEARHDG